MKHLIRAAIAAGILISASAQAALTPFNSRAAFNAATGSTTIETFNSYTSDVSLVGSTIDFGAFTVKGTTNPYAYLDASPAYYPAANVNGTTQLTVNVYNEAYIEFTFDTAITAFGADFGSINDGFLRSKIVVNGVEISAPVAGASESNTVRFFGFTSDTAFTSIRFVDLPGETSDGFGIDNVTFGAVSAVPEPTTWAMLIAGLAAVGATLRRKRTRVAFA